MKPKIYDCFMFFNELEVLEIRLDVMSDFVDYFVLVEDTHTHSAMPKELIFNENKHRFDTSKIIHVIVEDSPRDSDAWVNENYQRNCIARGLVNADPDDVIIISDVDEIPNPRVLCENLDELERSEVFSLKQKTFYYYVNCLQEQIWCSPVVTKLKYINTPQETRRRRWENLVGEDGEGGWHYGYIGGRDRIKQKIESFAHQEFNNDEIKDLSHIETCMETGADLYHRTGEIFQRKFVSLEGNAPDCMNKYIKKYPYLVKNL
jgi:beta-1,4-mannosyl-glycoprotein beta-1,4-N-acetylglucosaminyltransferase